jgi:hypothetical protein
MKDNIPSNKGGLPMYGIPTLKIIPKDFGVVEVSSVNVTHNTTQGETRKHLEDYEKCWCWPENPTNESTKSEGPV